MVESLVAFVLTNTGLATALGGFVASEILAFLPVKYNSVTQLLATLLKGMLEKITKQAEVGAAASAPTENKQVSSQPLAPLSK